MPRPFALPSSLSFTAALCVPFFNHNERPHHTSTFYELPSQLRPMALVLLKMELCLDHPNQHLLLKQTPVRSAFVPTTQATTMILATRNVACLKVLVWTSGTDFVTDLQ